MTRAMGLMRGMTEPARARWARMSPQLDVLLDLATRARENHLDEMRHRDASLADALRELLDELSAVEREAFLESPPFIAPENLTGWVLGAYTLEREVGHGGMGSVWLARRTDGRYEGSVAIKFLNLGPVARGEAAGLRDRQAHG